MKIEWKMCRMEKQKKNGALLYGNEVCTLNWWMKNFPLLRFGLSLLLLLFLGSWWIHTIQNSNRFMWYMWMCVFVDVDVDEDNKSARYKIQCRDTASERARKKQTHTKCKWKSDERERERNFSFSKIKTSTKMTCTISECLQNNITIFLWIEWKWNITQGINSSRIMAHTYTKKVSVTDKNLPKNKIVTKKMYKIFQVDILHQIQTTTKLCLFLGLLIWFSRNREETKNVWATQNCREMWAQMCLCVCLSM